MAVQSDNEIVMKISGIYKIESKLKPERIYIGSTININIRWNKHLTDLKKNRHHSIKLQNHYNKYGESDLQFSILVECEKENLLKIEQEFIDSYKPYFNICPIAGNCTGIHRSEKEKQKCREYRHTEEAKKKISEAGIGREVSAKSLSKLLERRCVKVIDTDTGIIYDSIIMAANAFGIKRRTLENKLHGNNGVNSIRNNTTLRLYKEVA